MNFLRLSIFLIFCVTLVTGCGTAPPPDAEFVNPEEMGLQNTPTEPPKASTPIPTFTLTPILEPTATSTPVPTFTPTPSPSSTPAPAAKINPDLTAPVNVREGPGTNYPVVGRFEAGEETTVAGRNEDGSWWQVRLAGSGAKQTVGWVYGELVILSNTQAIPVVEAPPTPIVPTPESQTAAQAEVPEETENNDNADAATLEEQLRCGKDFCVTYQAMVPMAENGGCVGNHSIYITVLEGPPPGRPMDGVVIGDTFNNVEMASGSHGPGRTEITLWSNSMTLVAKRHIDDTPYTSEESFNFTSHDELIPAEILAANGYCGGTVEQCERDRNNNSVCRGHYSWRVTFHKFD